MVTKKFRIYSIHKPQHSTSHLSELPSPQLHVVRRTCSAAVLVVGAVGVMTGVAGGKQSSHEGGSPPNGVVEPVVLCFVGVNGEQ